MRHAVMLRIVTTMTIRISISVVMRSIRSSSARHAILLRRFMVLLLDTILTRMPGTDNSVRTATIPSRVAAIPTTFMISRILLIMARADIEMFVVMICRERQLSRCDPVCLPLATFPLLLTESRRPTTLPVVTPTRLILLIVKATILHHLPTTTVATDTSRTRATILPLLRLPTPPDPILHRESARSSSNTCSNATATIPPNPTPQPQTKTNSIRIKLTTRPPSKLPTAHLSAKNLVKKVKKACVFCKRSHMPCEEARPCKRCVKRGISHLCRDAEPVGSASAASSSSAAAKAGKFGEARQQARARRSKQDAAADHQHAGETESESDLESLASSAASSLPFRRATGSDVGVELSARARRYDINVIPGATPRDPHCRPAMPVSMLISPMSAELARRPSDRRRFSGVSEKEQEEAWNRSMDLRMQHKMKQMLEAGPAGGDLSDIFGEMPTSLLMTPAMANLPDGHSILRPASTEPHSSPDSTHRASAYKRSASESLPPTTTTTPCQVDEAGFKLPARPKHLLQEEMATTSELRGGAPTYSYTYGYAKLARWMHARYSRENCEQVDRSLSVIRPKLMALSRSLPEEELIAVEEKFYQLLDFYQTNVLETIPVPMIVARRTGEIYAANTHACKLLQLPPTIFEGGQICHYQLVTEKDCVNMWGKYAAEAEGKLDNPPTQEVMLEVDRSLLLFDKPGFNPRTGELLVEGGKCEDGSPVVVRKRCIVTFEAKISRHGLPFMVTGCMVPFPDEEGEAEVNRP